MKAAPGMISFRQYLTERGGLPPSPVSEGWRDFLPSRSKPFDPGRRRFLGSAAATAMASGAALADAPRGKMRYEPHAPYTERLIAAIQQRFSGELKRSGATITKGDVAFIRPREVLEQGWGDKFRSVVDRAAQAQSEPGTEADQSVTMVKNIDKPIMVVFMDPRNFGLKEAHGFHHFLPVDGERYDYIVVRPDIDEAYLRHEMRHALQNPRSFGTKPEQFLGDDSDPLVGYLTNYPELGVRFAELRMRHYQLTGKLVEDKESDVEDMIIHLMRNKEKYPADVRQLVPIMDLVESKGKLKLFLRYMRRNMTKYVKGDPSRILGLGGAMGFGVA